MRITTIVFLIMASSAINQTALAANDYIDVAIGSRSICAIDTANQLECTTLFESATFLPPDDGTSYTDVSVGQAHACAVTLAGDVRCWGLNGFGQLDVPESDSTFVSVSAGENHTCAIGMDQEITCWGLNTNEQTNVPDAENFGFVSVFAGSTGSCGIRDNGETICWSTDNRYFQYRATARYTDVVAGGGGSGPNSCGLQFNGDIQCWFIYPHVTTEVPDNGPYTAIDANFAMICGLTDAGKLDCGAAEFQSLSLDESIQKDIATFEALPPLKTFEIRQVNLSSVLCGIDMDDQLVCAGDNLPVLSLPGEEPNQYVVDDLDVSYYSDTTIELMWSLRISPQRGEIPWVGFNVYRDGAAIAYTSNGGSYYDDTLEAGVDYQYAIATIDLDGNESALSNTITVNTNERNAGPDNGGTTPIVDSQPTGLTLTRYSESSLELFWERSRIVGNASYQIYRNGEFLATARGISFFDDSASQNKDWHYSVALISSGESVRGVAFVTAPAETTQCF